MEKEINPLAERKEIMQEVIDRHIKYGAKYVKALKKLNERYPTSIIVEDSSLNPTEQTKGNVTTSVGSSQIRVYGKKQVDEHGKEEKG